MIKIIHFIICICIFCTFSSCSEKKEQIEHFELEGTSWSADLPFMRYPYRIEFMGDKLVLFDMASDSLFYHAISYPELRQQYSFGKRGDAPGEITLCTPFQICNNNMVIMDGARGDFYYCKLMDTLQNVAHKKIDMMRAVDFVCEDDSTLLVQDMSGKCRLLEFRSGNRKELFSIPESSRDSDGQIGYLWRSFMAYNPVNKKVALATQFGDVLEIYDVKNDSCTVIVGSDGKPHSASKIQGYHDIKWHNNLIYSLYSGRSMDDLSRKFDMGKKEPDGGNIVKVFDENGKLLKEYKLNVYINGFTFIENKLIGVSSNSDNPIYAFELK